MFRSSVADKRGKMRENSGGRCVLCFQGGFLPLQLLERCRRSGI